MKEISEVIASIPEGVSYEIEVITPEIAEKYLTYNTENRPIRAGHVQRLSDDMKNNRWAFTPDPICFRSGDGTLMNGQHRLKAVALSGVSVPLMVIHGIDESAWSKMDRGVKRTTGDEFARLGVKNATHTAAAIRLLKRYETDQWGKDFQIGDDELVDFYQDSHPELMSVLSKAKQLSREIPIPLSASIVCLYLSSLADLTDTGLDLKEWEDEVIRGVGVMMDGSPSLQFRRQLIRRENNRLKTSQRNYVGLYARAWRAWATGKPVKALRFTEQDAVPCIENPFAPIPRRRI